MPQTAQTLNTQVFCRSLDWAMLRHLIEHDPSLQGLAEHISQTRGTLFAHTFVFVASAVQQQILETVAAVERVAKLPGYQDQALARASALALRDWGPLGACMGYDFHLDGDQVKLIEINTNAGGLLLNAALTQAQQDCANAPATVTPPSEHDVRAQVWAMFAREWALQRGNAPWQRVLIVDDAPTTQYLAPEFALYKQLFAQHALDAQIADPAELSWRDGSLWHQGQPVQMVYNRLTDFDLSAPEHAALRCAYEAGAVVLTPHPRAHALMADKRNLVALSQPELLRAWGAQESDIQVLERHIPTTRMVEPAHADALWAQRRQLFFKPVAGYGGKAAYRGDKLTQRVWREILQQDYVAQALVPPAVRTVDIQGVATPLKFDLRAFTYDGQVQLLAARLYSGQTTNFRTEGGGFAPVRVLLNPTQDAGAD
ncbi:MAG: hypothetical protein OHK0048_11880 [Rhodoferax sp.]